MMIINRNYEVTCTNRIVNCPIARSWMKRKSNHPEPVDFASCCWAVAAWFWASRPDELWATHLRFASVRLGEYQEEFANDLVQCEKLVLTAHRMQLRSPRKRLSRS